MGKRRGDGIYDKRAFILEIPWDWLRHMSPWPDNDASVMFSRQDKQIGSDLTKEATEAHIAIVLSIL